MISLSLVGCGRISDRHVSAINNCPNLNLISAYDIDSKKASLFNEKYSIPAYDSLQEMINSNKADVVVILTSSGNHFSTYLEVRSFFDHIIIEKPLTLRIEDAREIIKDEISGKNIYIVKQNRFNKPVVLCKQLIEDGLLGDLFLGSIRVRWCRTQDYYNLSDWRGTWANDGGVLANQAIHHIDLLLYLMGGFKSVDAITRNFGSEIEVEDTAIAQIEFTNGSIGIIEATTATRPTDLEGSISLLGTSGAIDIGGFAVNSLKRLELNDENRKRYYSDRIAEYSENPPNVYGYGHNEFYKRVSDSITNLKPDKTISASSGIACLELLHSIYVSAAENRRVFSSEKVSYKPLGNSNNN